MTSGGKKQPSCNDPELREVENESPVFIQGLHQPGLPPAKQNQKPEDKHAKEITEASFPEPRAGRRQGLEGQTEDDQHEPPQISKENSILVPTLVTPLPEGKCLQMINN